MGKFEDYRSSFCVPRGLYFLSHSVGCLPRSTKQALFSSFLDSWEQSAGNAWPGWMDELGVFCHELGRLVGAEPNSLCPQVNVSSAMTKILGSRPVGSGRNQILLSEQDFPSIGYVCQQAEKLGYELVYLSREQDLTDEKVWTDAISDKTALVFITHVISNTSVKVPVARITAHARKKGALSVVDVAQSVGVVPFSVSEWEADFVIGTCQKWLCGGPGTGFLWGREDVLTLSRPADVGWFSHEDPFCFDIHDFKYARGAQRFMGGTPSVVPFVMAAQSLKILNEIGLDEISTANQDMTRMLLDAFRGMDVEVLTPDSEEKRGGSVVIRSEKGEGLYQALRSQGVATDLRDGKQLRFSPHIYTSIGEVQELIRLLDKSLKKL